MKQIQKRMLLQILLGFLLGRVIFFERNPVGVAYFAAGFPQGGAVFPVAIAICLGMLSSLQIEMVIRYGIAMAAVAVAADLFRQRHMRIKMGHCALVMAFTLAVLSVVQYYLLPFQGKDILFSVMDVILVLVFSRILYEGQNFLLHARKGQGMENEEMISLIIIGTLAIYGLPDVMVADISVIELAVYFLLPAMGYQYGAGVGAVAGAAGGTLLVLTGQSGDMIGSLCLLGICAGMLRKQGKVWMLSAFLVTAVSLGVMLNGQMLQEGTLKAIVIDSVLLMLLPDKYMRKLRFPAKGWEEGHAGEYFQVLMNHKLKDFSESFQNLSQVLARQSAEKTGFSNHDVRILIQEMSQQVCEKCENRERCMGQVALSKPESIGMLAMAQEQGNLVLEQMPIEFTRECIHPDRFLMETNQSLRMARTIMSFQNKLAQNRQVIAGQMAQVGTLMKELAEDISQVNQLPAEMEEVIEKELGNMRVDVRNLVIYEDKDGRLEVHMLACTTRGRLVTAREAAGVLTDLIGKPFMPSVESRNVIPREECQMIFVEDTPLYAVTGVARAAKDGEEVSGDTFSCLSLPNGELLLALSDGMGSGESALEDSQTVIELLEQMTEAGFSKISAMRLINSLYMPEEEDTHYATADVVVLNLYQGVCQFIKNGAAATWLRRGKEVERVEGQALPVGVVQDAEPYLGKTQINSGDYVIMMTDGIADVFSGREEELENLLLEKKIVNPQELAEYILEETIERCGGFAYDDMSVIVAGIWERV
ncbi:MAG: SpoIIE family protein phosphatase [Lachnospiraceae bacterium]|nr:SpoIIE family protein phosphatase [Lachnospiraceae bacterium]